MNYFGRTLKRIRMDRKISQNKLASAADIDHSYMSKLESGTRFPSREIVLRLAKTLRCDDVERHSLLTSAGFYDDVELDHDLVELHELLHDDDLDPACKDAIRTMVKAITTFALTERSRLTRSRSVVVNGRSIPPPGPDNPITSTISPFPSIVSP